MASGRYVLVPDGQVSVELTPDEWAVALDALEKVQSDRSNGYSSSNRAALTRTVGKLIRATAQLRGLHDAAPDDAQGA